jgi:hypothetical protein
LNIERWTPAPAAVAVAEPFDEPAAEILKVDGLLQDLQRGADLAQALKML